MTAVHRVLCALVLAFLSGVAWAEPATGMPVIAIVGTGQERQSPQLQAMQEGLVHLVQSEMQSRAAAQIVSRRQVALFLDELGMAAAELTEPGTAQRFGRAVSADYLVFLRLSPDASPLTAGVTVQRVADGLEAWRGSASGSAAALATLAQQIAADLMEGLKLGPAPPVLPAAPGPVPTLAVLDFCSEGAPGMLDRHLAELADLLSANLTALELPLVERARLSTVLRELGLSAAGLAREAELSKLGKLVGAERVLDTSMMASDRVVLFDAQVLEPQTGRVLASCRATGAVTAVPTVLQDLALKVAAAVRAPVSQAGRQGLARQETESLEAALHAAAGWRLGWENRPEEAIRELQQAIYLDPGIAWVWEELARQYETIRDYEKWAECARRFFPAAEGKADRRLLVAMAKHLADAEMWQRRFGEEEAAARLAMSYDPSDSDIYGDLIQALVRQGKAKEVREFCESVYRQDEAPYSRSYDAWAAAIYWLGYPGVPSNYRDDVIEVLLDTISQGMDIFDREVPDAEFRLGKHTANALLMACGARSERGVGVDLHTPLRHGEGCLKLAKRMTTYTGRRWTSGRGWFVVGLIEYKLGHGREAEEALTRCLSYPDVSFDIDTYGAPAPTYGLVYYLLGHTYQDLLKDPKQAVACYQKACFWLTFAWPEAQDSLAQLAALGATPGPRTEWRHMLGTAGPLLAKAGREELLVWLRAHGYNLRFEFAPQEVQRSEEGVQLLIWEGRFSDLPPAEELRAYVAGGGSLLVLLADQLYLAAHEPILSGSAESLDVTLDWLLPAFGMRMSRRAAEAETGLPLLPGKAQPALALSAATYTGMFFPIEVPEAMSLLQIGRPGQSPPDTVVAIGTLGLGKVAVISLRKWFAARNIFAFPLPEWQSQLLEGVMDWLSTPLMDPQSDPARAWAAARALVAAGDAAGAVQELDRVAVYGGVSAADASYWAGRLADRIGDGDGAAQRLREVLDSPQADAWLKRRAHLRLGILAMRAGNGDVASRSLADAAGTEPDGIWGQAWVAAGDLKLAQGDYLGAAQAFRKVADELGHSEERFRALFGLACAFGKMGKQEAADRVWDAIVVEFGKALLPPDLDARWSDPWDQYYPRAARAGGAKVADAVAVQRQALPGPR